MDYMALQTIKRTGGVCLPTYPKGGKIENPLYDRRFVQFLTAVLDLNQTK